MQDSRVLILECVTGAQMGAQYRKCCVTLFVLMWENCSVSEKKRKYTWLRFEQSLEAIDKGPRCRHEQTWTDWLWLAESRSDMEIPGIWVDMTVYTTSPALEIRHEHGQNENKDNKKEAVWRSKASSKRSCATSRLIKRDEQTPTPCPGLL